jgi:hypothetical protein
MKRLLLLLIPVTFLALSGCVVVPAHGYYRAGAVVAVPAPVVSVRAYAW